MAVEPKYQQPYTRITDTIFNLSKTEILVFPFALLHSTIFRRTDSLTQVLFFKYVLYVALGSVKYFKKLAKYFKLYSNI